MEVVYGEMPEQAREEPEETMHEEWGVVQEWDWGESQLLDYMNVCPSYAYVKNLRDAWLSSPSYSSGSGGCWDW